MSWQWFHDLSDRLSMTPMALKQVVEVVLAAIVVLGLRQLVVLILRRHGEESPATRRFVNTGTLFVALLMALWKALQAEWTDALAAAMRLEVQTLTGLLVAIALFVLLLMVRHVLVGVISQRIKDERNAEAARRVVNTVGLFVALLLLLSEVVLSDWIDEIAAITKVREQTVDRLLYTAILLVAVLMARHVAFVVIGQRMDDVRKAYHARRVINYLLGFIAILAGTRIWILGSSNLGTFFGLLSAGIAIALSDLLASLAGWIFISVRRPYVVGDRVQVGGHIGDVVDIRLFQTFLLECGNWVDAEQSTGRIVMVPNGLIFKQSTANYTRGFEYLWDELYVLVTFESDWRRTKEVLTQIANEHAQPLSQGAQAQLRRAASRHMIFFRNLTPIVYTSVKDSGVQFSIRYLTPARQRRGSAERLWEAILDAFAKEPKIDLAYPTTRYYSNYIEGKEQARAAMPGEGRSPSARPV